MGNEFRYVCLVETRRLLLLMGVGFGIVLFVQYFELPYTNVISSLFATSKSETEPIDNYLSKNSSSKPNSTDLDVANGVFSNIKETGVKDSDARNATDDFPPENISSLNETLGDDIDPEDESPSKDQSSNRKTPSVAESPSNLLDFASSPETAKANYVESTSPITPVGKDAELHKDTENPEVLEAERSVSVTNFSISTVPTVEEELKGSEPSVVTVSGMNDMLLQSRVSYKAVESRWSSKADQELVNSKYLIENPSIIEKDPQFDVNLYRNFSAFKRSYELMEQTLKVYIYAEGEQPIFHRPPLKGIYASEGWFMKLLKANKRFVTRNPKKAHLFYFPFSSRSLEETLYVPNSHSRKNLIEYLSNYIELIRTKHNFWNRTSGADHFLVACHDWAPAETREIMANCIRAMCNADIKEGFVFGKDVSLPETFVKSPQNPLRELGGKPPSQRRILAFFAGSMHGYLRPILLKHWENKDPDMKIFGKMSKAKGKMSYAQYMKSSKYCICAKGFEVNSPRVVEAIFYECVPVIISDNFVPPFFEALNWESFAVFVLEKDIPDLKNILVSIPKKRYVEMQRRVKKVQQHFLWHPSPVKYDVFHMILHSVWYNRVFQTR